MERLINNELKQWVGSPSRKSLILRGARQVGKTFAVRQLAKQFDNFIEINFESKPNLKSIFAKDLDAKRIVRDLSLEFNQLIEPGKTLLFFDEIQEEPRAIIALRYLYEELPKLHVIAAGSLLDFAIEQIGVPVGRVQFLYMFPLSFIEFLMATDRAMAAKAIVEQKFPEKFSENIHNKFLEYTAEYLAIGGMPEVVGNWAANKDVLTCREIQHGLVDAYRQDFAKYSKKNQIKYVELLFDNIPSQLGNKFKFSKVSGGYRKRELYPCLELLEKARVITTVYHSSSQGIPLAAQKNHDKFKVVFLDIALSQAMLGYELKDWFLNSSTSFINKGQLIESFVGQELLSYANSHTKPQIYYWQREQPSSNAEIDYVLEHSGNIVPIEVKSGKGSTLKSMNIFLKSHVNSIYGVRFSTQDYSKYNNIHSYPLYAVAGFAAQSTPEILKFINNT